MAMNVTAEALSPWPVPLAQARYGCTDLHRRPLGKHGFWEQSSTKTVLIAAPLLLPD